MDFDNEIELKLEITEEIYRTIIKNSVPKKIVVQENIFFDTPERTLGRNLWALRVRFQEQEAILTAKGPKENLDGIHIRPEYEEGISMEKAQEFVDNGFELKKNGLIPIKKLVEKFGHLQVAPFLRFNNKRTYIPWRSWTLELDESKVGEAGFYELEVETTREESQALMKAMEEYFELNGWEIKISKTNKLYKAMQLLS